MVYATLKEENKLWKEGYKLVCGVDEVGRGCFAGPVVVGAVIFPIDTELPQGIADSKLLSEKKRLELDPLIKNSALAWAIAEVDVETINKIGIGKATQKAFLDAVNKISPQPDFILIDAFLIEGVDKAKQKAIIGGDRLVASIAAASIIAKVYRDNLMQELDIKYPQYGLARNKGYGTKFHRDMIKTHGLSSLHRSSFNLQKFL